QEKTIAAMAVPEANFTNAEESDATIKQEKARIQPLKDAMKSIEENTQNPNREPTYLQLRQRVRKIEQTVEERRKELRPEVEKKWRQTVKVELDSKINGLQADVDALTVQEGKLKTEADNLRKEIQKIVTGTREDENLRAEIDNQRAFVRDL